MNLLSDKNIKRYYDRPAHKRFLIDTFNSIVATIIFILLTLLINTIVYYIIRFFTGNNNSLVDFIAQPNIIGYLITPFVFVWYLVRRFMNFAKEYCLDYRPEKAFLNRMIVNREKINNLRVYNFFKDYILSLSSPVREKIFDGLDEQNKEYVDLAKGTTLTSFLQDKDTVELRGGDTLISEKSKSRIRRMNILKICKSLLKQPVTLFYATEFHLKEVINDQTKWNNDKKYRDDLKSDNSIKNLPKDKKIRIIGVKKSDYNDILNNRFSFDLLIEYLKWHITNNWDAKFYIIKDDLYPLTLVSFDCNNEPCNCLTDFLYVEYNHGAERVVFAQNDEGLCKYFSIPPDQNYDPNPIEDYKSLFEDLREHHVLRNEVMYTVNNDFISQLKIRKQR